jgi:hypothetical protein
MTAVNGNRVYKAACLHCGTQFVPMKYGHVYCSTFCRHRGPRSPLDAEVVDHEQIARLFDLSRDPAELVRDDDWFGMGPEWKAIYAMETVAGRRRWYLALVADGRVKAPPVDVTPSMLTAPLGPSPRRPRSGD